MKKLLFWFILLSSTCYAADFGDFAPNKAKQIKTSNIYDYYGSSASPASVETCLNEIGAGTTLDDHYVNITGDTMTGALANTATGTSYFNEGLTINEASGGTANDDLRAETTSEANAFVVDASGDDIEINVPLSSTDNINTLKIASGETVVANTMTLATGSITDTTGAISFGNENLITTGTLGAGAITGTSLTDGTATLDDGSITGAVDATFSDGLTISDGMASFTGSYSSATEAPLVVRNTTAYANPWNQYAQIWLNAAGTLMAFMRNDGTFYMTGQVKATDAFYAGGTASENTMYGFIYDTDTGLSYPVANSIGFKTAGTRRWTMDSSGHLLAGTDGTGVYNITTAGTLGAGAGTLTSINLDGGLITTDGAGTLTWGGTSTLDVDGSCRPSYLQTSTICPTAITPGSLDWQYDTFNGITSWGSHYTGVATDVGGGVAAIGVNQWDGANYSAGYFSLGGIAKLCDSTLGVIGSFSDGATVTVLLADYANGYAINAILGPTNLDNGGFITSGAGKVGTYNSIATVSNGIPSELATVDLTAQSAAKTATTIYTPAASGMFRISVSLQVTRAATTSSVLGGATGVTITYTEPDGSVAQSIKPLLTDQAGAVVVPATGNIGNATTTQSQGSAIIYAKTGVAIQYAIGYTSVGATTMQYSAHLKVEAM